MKAIRQIVKPVNHQVTIQLPEEFNEDKEVEIIVLPANEPGLENKPKRVAGLWKGVITMSSDFNEPLEEFKEYME